MTEKQRTGVLLLNLGGPDSLDAVRPFLYNLFSDRDIIRLGPSFLQRPLAWLISALRSEKTRSMYRQIGGRSPILDITKAQAEALEKALNEEYGVKGPGLSSKLQTPNPKLCFRVYIGMRYWRPFVRDTLDKIISDGTKDLIVLSMYPHYSKATTGSSVDEFKRLIKGKDINVRYIEQWYDFPPYIESLAELVAKGASEFRGKDFELLYSAHSLPQSFIDEGDPYLDHIKATINKVNERLGAGPYNMSGLKSRLSFQSKTGPVKWLGPSTEETMIDLANKGCRNLLVVPVSFVSDHIETLYEIDILYKQLAESLGMDLRRCGSLNTNDRFIFALKELILSTKS